MPSNLLVANDVLCKFFAINGAPLVAKGAMSFTVCQISSKWEDTQLGYSQFLYWGYAAIYLNFASFTTGMTGVNM